jgi:membrane-associated protein
VAELTAPDWRFSVIHTSLLPWLDPEVLINSAGPWALVLVCAIVFAETGLLVGFLLPGDTLLVITGLVTGTLINVDIWWVCLAIGLAAFLGGEVGYLIGHKLGPRVFERKESGIFSIENVRRTNTFFTRFGGLAVILARFIPIVRTFAPVAAGVGHMNYRKYSLYNLIGAMIWGAGLVYFGHLLNLIPPVADFVKSYIDLILVGAVLITLIPTIFHYVQSSRKAKRAARTGTVDTATLILDPEAFEAHHDGRHETKPEA